MMVATFEPLQNLPVPVFAKLPGKSRYQINREIKSRRLFSLTLGNRGHRIFRLATRSHRVKVHSCGIGACAGDRLVVALSYAVCSALQLIQAPWHNDEASRLMSDQCHLGRCRRLSASASPSE